MWKLIGQSNNPWLYSDSRRDFYGCEDIKANVAWERLINVMKVKKKKFVCFIRLLMMNCERTIYNSECYLYE